MNRMAGKSKKRGRGRPPKDGIAASIQLNVRISPDLSRLIDKYRAWMEKQEGPQSDGDAVRDMIRTAAKMRGIN